VRSKFGLSQQAAQQVYRDARGPLKHSLRGVDVSHRVVTKTARRIARHGITVQPPPEKAKAPPRVGPAPEILYPADFYDLDFDDIPQEIEDEADTYVED